MIASRPRQWKKRVAELVASCAPARVIMLRFLHPGRHWGTAEIAHGKRFAQGAMEPAASRQRQGKRQLGWTNTTDSGAFIGGGCVRKFPLLLCLCLTKHGTGMEGVWRGLHELRGPGPKLPCSWVGLLEDLGSSGVDTMTLVRRRKCEWHDLLRCAPYSLLRTAASSQNAKDR